MGTGLFRRTWWWLIPGWVLLAWLFRGLLAGEAFFEGDVILVFYPLKKYLAACLALHEFPEWWPFDALGQPLSSLPLASLYHPTTLLYLALPFALAWTLQTLVPLALAPIGTWFLARTLGLKQPAAAVATLLVAVSFWHVLLAGQTQMHLAAASLPWFWREGIRVCRSRRGSVVVLALATANMVVGGDPMLLQLAAVGLFPLVVRRRFRPAPWLRLVGAGVLGVGLAGVQAIPMLFAFDQSPRAGGLNIDVNDLWAMRSQHFTGLVIPAHYASDFLFDTVYVGLPVLVLAVLGLSRPWRFRWPLLTVLLLLVITALGRAGPLWHLWSALLPGWKGYQFPGKALGPAVLPLALLAARGLQLEARRFAWPAFGIGGLLLAATGLMTAGLHVVAGLAGLLIERRQGARPRRLLPATALTVMVLLGLDVAAQLGTVPTRPFELLETPPALTQAIQGAGVSLTGGSYEWSWSVPPDFDQRFPDWRQRETDLMVLLAAPSSGAIFGLPTTRQYLAGVTRRVFEISKSSREQDYLWRLQLSQVFGAVARVQNYTTPLPATTLGADADLGAAVLRLPGGLPRAYVAFAVTPLPEEAQLGKLNSGFHPGLEALVAPGDAPGLPALVEAAPRAMQSVPVTRGVDSFQAQLTLEAPGLLVINEAYARGWSARVDGAPATLIPANHAVMGLPLAPGSHQVELEYSTPGLVPGLVISALCAALLAGWVLLRRRARR